MSFTVFYNAYDDLTQGFLRLTAIIGEDAKLYWICKDVLKVLGRCSFYECFQSEWLRVEDITGRSHTPFSRTLARCKVIPHERVVKLLKESSRPTIRAFGFTLDYRETRAQVFNSNGPIQVNVPVQVLLLKPPLPDSGHDPIFFYIWYHFFKQKVMSSIYVDRTLYSLQTDKKPETILPD